MSSPRPLPNLRVLLALGVLSFAPGGVARGVAAADSEFAPQVRAVLQQHCLACHAGPQAKGDLDLERLGTDLTDDPTAARWSRVVQRLSAGEMPPEDRPRLTAEETRTATQGIQQALRAARRDQRAREGRVTWRRLNRVEYENTLRDLLGVQVVVRDLLPPDSSADGFDNVGAALHVSSFLLERYLAAADAALHVAIANGPAPRVIRQRYSLRETHQVKVTTESVFRQREDGGVVMLSSSPWQAVVLSPFYPPDRGRYRFRISASAVASGGRPVTYRVDAGLMLMTGKPHLVSYFDAPAEGSRVVEFVEELEPRETLRILPYGLASSQAVHKIGAADYDGPGLAIDWVEVEGPLHETWPPASHRRLFGDLPQQPVAAGGGNAGRVEVVSQDPLRDAERILRRFAARAWRRPVSDEELRPLVELVRVKLAEPRSFEQAVRVGLAAILVSPEFLFLHETPGPLAPPALASRLSYFLWSSLPDDELLAAAGALPPAAVEGGQGAAGDEATAVTPPRLADRSELRRQVERLLDDPRAQEFGRNFVGQWLGLRDIDFTIPSHILYPEFDEMLKVSMVRETELFFAELLRHDLSVTNFLASDFSVLNGRLARHYGIPGIEGWEFRRVPLPPDSHRGGVLTMASVLKVTANGTQTSPVTRGAWVLERILGITPPPPPENVSALEPDIRGATTIRQQLAKHRQLDACAGCHRQIDPLGFALESFDVIGGWREHYRTSGVGQPVTIDGRRMHYLRGPAVDPADTLSDGRSFRHIDDLKQLLLADRERFVRALTRKLVTYATGAAPTIDDEPEVERIVERVRERDYGFRSLIHEIVQSPLFQHK
ncbi:MAG: DUF1592 domain-containing protein [Pirellulales bacterium]